MTEDIITKEVKKEIKKLKRLKISKLKLYQIATAVLALALISMAVFFSMQGYSLTGTASQGDIDAVTQETVEFLNSNFGTTATIKSVEESNGVFAISLDIDGEEAEVYVTKDGSIVFPVAIPTSESESGTADQQIQPRDAAPAAQQTQTAAKSEKPNVELFIMSHCPYGTQMEKGTLPAVELLGDKIDFEIKFVYYAMHGQVEIDEQLNQYCIQKEQNDKFTDYLNCFLKAGDTETCLTETEIDTDALETCVAAADEEFGVTAAFDDKSSWLSGRYPLFNTHAEDNKKYSVGGSPTLVINGEQVSSSRDPASVLATICSTFENPPAECDETISSASPSPGFGVSTSAVASNSAAQCN